MSLNINIDNIENKVGYTIKSLRKVRGVTRLDLAKMLAVSPQQMAKYESGKNRVTAGKLFALANIFNVSTDYFFKDSEEIHILFHNQYSGDREQLDFTRNFMMISSDKKRDVVKLLVRIFATEEHLSVQ